MLRSTLSTTTMASSTTMPMASTRPNSDRLFSEKPNRLTMKKVPISETGMAMIGMIAARQVLQEQHHHDDHQHDGFEDGVLHRPHGFGDELRRIVRRRIGETLREVLGDAGHLLLDRLAGRQRVGARQLEDAERHRRLGIEVGDRGIVLPSMSMRATSRRRTTALPLWRTTMLPNSSGVDSRPSVRTATWKASCSGTGGAFSTPEATCRFCALSAAVTSLAVRFSACILVGSSQTCMA